MPKKILIAEKSDAIRSIAESILHQNGYDVISAATLEKAKELIITTQPNMIVVGADMRDDEGKFLYDSIEDNPTTTAIPLLLIADPDGRAVPYPDEVVLPRPFDQKDFLEKVRLFLGGGGEQPQEKVETIDPFAAGTIDDEFIDAALGIDNIRVESSEVVDKAWENGKTKRPKRADRTDAFDIHQPDLDEANMKKENQKVESLMIREEKSAATSDEKTDLPNLSASSKIEIISDQYGLVASHKTDEMGNRHIPHDYDWFIKEMQKEAVVPGIRPSVNNLQLTDNSEAVEPINISSTPVAEVPHNIEEQEKPKIKPGGVDQFIAEFKEEIEKLTAPQPETPIISPEAAQLSKEAPDISSEMTAPADKIPRDLDQDEIRHFSNYLAELLAEKMAKMLVEKIDAETIYRLLKDDVAKLISDKK